MAEAIKHDISITKGGVQILKQLLVQPNWYENQKNSVLNNAGDVEETLGDAQYAIEDTKDPTQFEKLSNARVSFQVTEGQREAVKIALRFFIKKAALANTKHVRILISQFGLSDE